MKKTKIVIVGGGFGGINAAKILAKDQRCEVIMLDKHNHHLFQPLLYQVATAGLSPADIATPIRAVLAKHPNCKTFLAKAEIVNLEQSHIKTDFCDFNYDYLILACGAQHSYFGNNEWEDHAPGLKTLEQAREIRRRIFLSFEIAERETDLQKIRRLLTFIVVGGGPTGVELAGTLGEISRFALSNEFSNIDPKSTRIILLEAGKRILPSFSEKISQKAMKDLENLGVQVWTQSAVTSIDDDGVQISKDRVNAATVLWAAGVKPSSLAKTLNTPLDKVGRVIVSNDLSIPNYSNAFVIGDMSSFLDKNNQYLPGVASVAIQQGKVAAKNIIADLNKKSRKDFVYFNRGQMATIGRSKAVMEVGNLKIGGFIAWLVWLFVHIYYLIGFRNRIIVMTQWALAFFTYRRGARIIQNTEWKSAKD